MSGGTPAIIDAFLRDVREQPEEDAPRLILADWLEEHGATPADRDRGDFIRVQCTLANLGPEDDRRGELKRREQELLRRHAAAWCGALQGRADRWHCERGLLHLGVSARRGFAILGTGSFLPWVEGLRVWGMGPAGTASLAGSPLMGVLTSLNLGCNEVGAYGVSDLALTRQRTYLASLNLGGNHIGDQGLTRLASSPVLSTVSTLVLWGNHLAAAGAQALAESIHATRLTTLVLTGNRLGPEGSGPWPAPRPWPGCGASTWRATASATPGPPPSPSRPTWSGSPPWTCATTASARPAPAPWPPRPTCPPRLIWICAATASSPTARRRWPCGRASATGFASTDPRADKPEAPGGKGRSLAGRLTPSSSPGSTGRSSRLP
jgi:uncharacterized protein (TIGR02996 family)